MEYIAVIVGKLKPGARTLRLIHSRRRDMRRAAAVGKSE
jgi:hypothetical protein